jgi:hypothetical protein
MRVRLILSQPVQEFSQEAVVTGTAKGVLAVQTEYFTDMQLFLLRAVREKFCGNNDIFSTYKHTHTHTF